MHEGFPYTAWKRSLGALAICALTVWATGCTSFRNYVHNGFKVGPNYCDPGAQVAPDWIDATDRRVLHESVDHTEWWRVFNDPALDTLVYQAYNSNLTLREAGYRITEARALRNITVGNLFPQTQGVFFDYTRRQTSASASNQVNSGTSFSTWETGAALDWELDFWGRYRRAVEAADADLDASVATYNDALVTLLADTAEAYVEMRTQQQRLVYLRQNVALVSETVKITDQLFEAGRTSKIDALQARAILNQAEAAIPVIQVNLRQANNKLAVLKGEPPRDLIPEIGPGAIPTAPPDVALGIPADLLTRRPDIRRAERLVAAESARIGVAESELYPHISVSGIVGVQANTFDQLFKGNAGYGFVNPGLQWNVLNYGRLQNNVLVHDARYEQAVARYRQQVLTANREVEDALVAFLESHLRRKSLQQGVAALTEGFAISREKYAAGLTPFVQLVQFQEDLVLQQDALARTEGDLVIALIRVYRALGGGWQISCAEALPAEVVPTARERAEALPTPAKAEPMPAPMPAPGQLELAPSQPGPQP